MPGCYIVIIGGMAVQELGWERFTKDVDVLVDSGHFSAMMQKLREAEFELHATSVLKHKHSGVEVDLLREGTSLKGSSAPLPHPKEIGPNLGTASLPGLIRLKLIARRRQDLADVVALMKLHQEQRDSVCAAIPESLRKEFLDLAEEARRENS